MAAYIVAYDLVRATPDDYKELQECIYQTGYNVARIQLSTFLVASDLSAFEIRDRLRPYIRNGENLIVAKIGDQVAGVHDFSKDVCEWLATYLR